MYSFHKTSTRPFLLKLLNERWKLDAEVVAEMRFDIKNMYKFHKQKCVDVEVDLLRIDTTRVAVDDGGVGGDGKEGGDVGSKGEEGSSADCEPEEEARGEDEESEGEEMPLGLCGHA